MENWTAKAEAQKEVQYDESIEQNSQRIEDEKLRVVSTEETKSILEDGTGAYLIFDARPNALYDQGHLPQAMPFPNENRDDFYGQYQDFLLPEQAILTYCSGTHCDAALELALFLREAGCTNVAIYFEGYEVWTNRGEAVEGGGQ